MSNRAMDGSGSCEALQVKEKRHEEEVGAEGEAEDGLSQHGELQEQAGSPTPQPEVEFREAKLESQVAASSSASVLSDRDQCSGSQEGLEMKIQMGDAVKKVEEGGETRRRCSNMAAGKVQTKTPLLLVAEAFEDLANSIDRRKKRKGDLSIEDAGKGNNNNAKRRDIAVDTFCDACSLVSVLFSCLGFAFKFAESEYAHKVRDLEEASKTYDCLPDILDEDVANGTVRTAGSHSRNLRRVRQGLDLIRALFEQFLAADDYSLKDVATSAYTQVCAPFHSWAIRAAVYAGMYALPSRDQLLINLNETDQTADKKMKRFIQASIPVIEYIDDLYTSRDISLDW